MSIFNVFANACCYSWLILGLFTDFGMSCWFCVVTLVLYLLSEDSTIALYLHFMSIQGNTVFSVTLRNLSLLWRMLYIIPTSFTLPLPPRKTPNVHRSLISIYPSLNIEPFLFSVWIILVEVSEVMKQVMNTRFQWNS